MRRAGNPALNRGPQRERQQEDEELLASPAKNDDPAAFIHTDPWRVMRITSEFVTGFERLAEIGPAVTIFGSAG